MIFICRADKRYMTALTCLNISYSNESNNILVGLIVYLQKNNTIFFFMENV